MKIQNEKLIDLNEKDYTSEILNIPTGIKIIGNYACHNLKSKKVVIPEGVSVIEDYAFYQSEGVEEIVLPESLSAIKERAFASNKNLKKIILPKNLTYIGNSAFCGCENLEEITIPKGVKKINYRAFANCKRLKKIILEDGIEEIDWAAFTDCQALEEIVIPNSVRVLNKQIFMNCKNLKRVTLPNHLTSLPDQLFSGCEKLDITLNKNIKELGQYTFEGCRNLRTFPKHIEKLGTGCFKNCKSLKEIELGPNINELPEEAFEECINLQKITSINNKPISIGKKCFKNCKSLREVPSFVTKYNDSAFESCESLTEINIVDYNIPSKCFRGCKNLTTINHQEAIKTLESFAFSGCSKLSEINLRNVIVDIPAEAFSNCKALKKIKISPFINRIGTRAFYNCTSLVDIEIPMCVTTINKEAFSGCSSLEEITIPRELKTIGNDAFYRMDSLKRIDVDENNKFYTTHDHKILIQLLQEAVILYAVGNKDKYYSLKDYNLTILDDGTECIRPIRRLAPHAFSNAKNLEELTLCGCTRSIEFNTFEGCDNLKKLNLEGISFCSCPVIHVEENGWMIFKEDKRKKISVPFEEITFTGNLVNISMNALQEFRKVKKLNLEDENSYYISSGAFLDCIELQEVEIPESVYRIESEAFPKSTKLKFKSGLTLDNLDNLDTISCYKLPYRIYTLKDGTYHIEQSGKITTINKDYIDDKCTNSKLVRDNPVLFLDFMNDLVNHDLVIKKLLNGILMKNISLENREILLDSLDKEDDTYLKVLTDSGILENDDNTTKKILEINSFEKVIDYVNFIKEKNIEDKIFYNRYLLAYYDIDDLKELYELDCPLLTQTLHKLLENVNSENSSIIENILTDNKLKYFIKHIRKNNIKDSFLLNKAFITIVDNPLADDFFKTYNANTKRLLKESKILENDSSLVINMNDLLTLLFISGALSNDPILSQKATTLITEKIFAKKLDNGNVNSTRIIGDDIHRVFNIETRDEFDQEFAQFFLENFKELIENEKVFSGITQRIYINFRGISKTSTSNKGSQRKLKVTMKKCLDYLLTVKFDNIEKNRQLANLIGQWYDRNEDWINALKVYNESLNAPRNIFTKVEYNKKNKPIYDNDPDLDLKEENNENYSYEWLPKQAYENLILGKYCSCCAHINGAGQGIMRASMILDNCQNLVIRNGFGEIIAKATIYVNKIEKYAVFNNVEGSLNYSNEKDKENIYHAFMRGAEAFFKTYNENNPENPLSNISIGANRNKIIDYLDDDNHPIVEVQESLHFGSYALDSYHGYNGDWRTKQRLVVKTIGERK